MFFISFIFIRWDYGIHVIKHMKTLEYLEPMKASTITSSSHMHYKIAIDLVLHGVNNEKEPILSIICTHDKSERFQI